MTAGLILDNILAWSAQICALAAAGFLAAWALTSPRARLLFWQAILVAALLLPALQPWREPVDPQGGVAAVTVTSLSAASVHRAGTNLQWRREYLLVVLVAGAILRLLWIGAGLFRLRRHRLDARMLTTPPVPFANPRVRWFVSSTVGGPVTFGFLNPSILLPARVLELPSDLREAIAHHELAHVRRLDWLFVLAEEAIRGLLWFHPGVWFVLSRIQLAREQVVDAEVVGLTRDRERYLNALVAVAAQRLLPDVAPAPLFLKKRQLAQRVAAVLKETRMSKPRLILTFTAAGSAAFLAAFAAVWMFPMQAPAQTPQVANVRSSIVADGPGVVVEPGAKIQHRPPVFFPAGVTTTGVVIVEASVDSKGEVTDAHVISGPDELRRAALQSVLNWHFSADGGLPPTIQSAIRFEIAPKVADAVPAPATRPVSLYLKSVDTSTLSADLAEKVQAAMPVHAGDAFDNAQLAAVRSAVKSVDEHLTITMRTSPPDAMLAITLAPPVHAVAGGVSGGVKGGVSGGVSGGVTGGVPGTLIQPGTVIQEDAPSPGRIRVGGNVQAINLIKKVTPTYPPEAKLARIQGTVRFTATIGKDGAIIDLEVVSGHPLLVESAKEAVSQWVYKPTLLNGNPVEVITQIDVNYTLSQ
ncbi:MAG TPA: M56 family metallopeptidase [Bryobacteraceae bacterium]|nr:M56 family metallopeptidase [Bryobacteraceae bacterium]